MSEEMVKLFNQRLGRYQAAIALEPTDRVPIAPGTNYFAEVYSGNTKQQVIYDSQKWIEGEIAFIRAFPEVDVLRSSRIWAPLFDAVDYKQYKLPGRDLPPNVQFQFIEKEYMRADEYDVLINNPVEFIIDRYLPRVFGEFKERGSTRSYIAFLKGGMAYVTMTQIAKERATLLETQFGMPQPMMGSFRAPFDVLGDGLRGLRGIITDMYRQPDKVLEACEVLVDEMVSFALATADPLKRYPIFVPTHKACFLSPKQFDTFYWPSFKKVMEKLIEAGYTIRAYLEGEWGPHWHHMLELPKGKVLCDIDTQGDIFQAKKDIGHHQCLAGGIPDTLFIWGTPEQMRERVKLLCETVGKDGGFIISGGCNIPYNTKPENFRAMIEATLEYGTYRRDFSPTPRQAPSEQASLLPRPKVVTPWEVKLAELGEIPGDAELIRRHWELFEGMAYTWLWQWVLL